MQLGIETARQAIIMTLTETNHNNINNNNNNNNYDEL